jgi:cell division protein FtsB
MVKSCLVGFFRGLNNLLQTPSKVIWICLALVVLNLVIDGSLLRLLTLYRDQAEIQKNLGQLSAQTGVLKKRLKHARDPAFMEREARDRFDLVSEGDLVFVFSEEGGEVN